MSEHSKRKHKILREYVLQYISVRCRHPQQPKFRFAIVDGFSGGGRYACGAEGSPVIFIEQLKLATEQINLLRIAQALKPIDIECIVIFNDANAGAISLLKENLSPLLGDIKETCSRLHLSVVYFNDKFEYIYNDIKKILDQNKIKNVLFNLDQCGHSYVKRSTLVDIIKCYQSEIFYTFSIQSFLAFLSRTNYSMMQAQLSFLNLTPEEFQKFEFPMSTEQWLGAAERLVFNSFQDCAPFVSPFSIHNPDGWRYWFIHFAKSYRARQVYNNVLHNNSSSQAHFGRAGLNMLSYDARHSEGSLYLFDAVGRKSAVDQLRDDIPELLSQNKDGMKISNFYESIYNLTPAHSADIHSSILDHPDLKILTSSGGYRRRASTINIEDIIILNNQRTIFSFIGSNSSL